MPGVSLLRVVSNPLADDQPQPGPGIIQQASDFLQSYGVTPECTLVGGVVGLMLDSGLSGALKGALIASLTSFAVTRLRG
jgi:hypothetical protein